MAPTRRRSRKRETRMDAALDTMSPYGFSNKLVRQTVHHLLKVYGGSDGWVFIEDSAYSLLIDTLLEKQASTSASPHDALIEDNPGDGPNEASPAGCSNRALLPCSNTETFDDSSSTNQAIDTVSAASETGNQLPIKALNTVSATCETDCQPAGNFTVSEIHGTPLACSPPLETNPPQTVERVCHQRRKPCHGWISDDDEEEELIVVELSPAPLCLK